MKKFTLGVLSMVLIAGLVMVTSNIFAQKTGQWDHNFSFNGRTEHITFNVPSNYNSSKKYKLFICAMGQGYTTQQYAAANGWPPGVGFYMNGQFGDVIVAVPGEGQQNSTYNLPPGEDNGIFETTISEAMKLYPNIDQAEVYLHGFSFGAHSALKEGTFNHTRYKGIMVFGLAPGLVDTNGDQTISQQELDAAYNYQAINDIAICMAVGSNDQNKDFSFAVGGKFYLASDSTWTYLKEVQGMGHQAPDQSLAYGAYNNCLLKIIASMGTTSIADNNWSNDNAAILAYPNPSNGIVNVDVIANGKSTVRVYNLTGQEVKKADLSHAGTVSFNISDQPKGIYMIRVNGDFGTITKKVVVK